MGKLYPVEQVEDATGFYPKPPHGWTCFHCGELFTTQGAARNHFGFDPSSDPACRIKVGAERGLVMALRKAEAELYEYTNLLHDESLEAYRLLARARSQHGDQIQTAEELGYERGLADGRIAATPAVDREGVVKIIDHYANQIVADYDRGCDWREMNKAVDACADAIMALPPVKQSLTPEEAAYRSELCATVNRNEGREPAEMAEVPVGTLRAVLMMVNRLDGGTVFDRIRRIASDGLAERVKEVCAVVADDDAAQAPQANGAKQGSVAASYHAGWEHAGRRIASAIRSLDITRMDSDEQV